MTKTQKKFYDTIYEMNDFPIFKYYNRNTKQFEDRALNTMSTRFLNHLSSRLDDLRRKRVVLGERKALIETVVMLVHAAAYAYYGNASYEAIGQNTNAHCGGAISIQEQFVVWASGLTVEDYRSNVIFKHHSLPYGADLELEDLEGFYEAIQWAKTSQLYELVKKTTRERK